VSQSLPYDFSADIWSMGVIFYEMITLKFKIMHYVRAMEEKDIYYQRIKEDILEVVDSQFKDELVEVVVSMLNLDPKMRIPLKDAWKQLDSISMDEIE
jgi:serine/threonine protein kinase